MKIPSSTIKVWDAVTGKVLAEPISASIQPTTVATYDGPRISVDSKYLVTQHSVGGFAPSNHAVIRELPSLKPVGDPLKLKGGNGGSIAVNSSGQIVTVTPDSGKGVGKGNPTKTSEIQLWDITTRMPIGNAHTVKFLVVGIAFNKGNKQVILSAGGFGTQESRSVHVYDLDKATIVGDPWPTGTVRQLVLDPDGKFAITRAAEQASPGGVRLEDAKVGTSWEVLRRWEIASGKNVGKPIHVRNLSSTPKDRKEESEWDDHAAVYSDARTAAVLKDQRTVQVVNMETGKLIGPPLMHAEPVYRMLFSADGKHLWTASASFARPDGCWLWDVASGKRIAQLPEEGKIVSMMLHPNEKLIGTVNDRGLVRTWNLTISK